MTCPRCQQGNPAEARFCMKCGASVTLACARGGTELPAGAAFCVTCGQALGAAPALAPPVTPVSYTPRHLVEKILVSAFLDPGAPLSPPGDRAVLDRQRIEQELRLVADEPLRQARVWLVAERADWPDANTGLSRLRMSDDLGQTWALDQERDLGGGHVALRWRPPAPGPVKTVHARSLAGFRIGVIALGGITATADAAAAARNAASQAEANKQKQAADDGPPKPGTPSTPPGAARSRTGRPTVSTSRCAGPACCTRATTRATRRWRRSKRPTPAPPRPARPRSARPSCAVRR